MKKDKLKPWSLTEQVFYTLILIGPLLWFIINLKQKNYDDLKINIPFAIISFIILIVTWTIFIRSNTLTKKTLLRGIFKTIVFIFVCFFTIIATILIFVGISALQEKLFVKENYIFYQFDSPYSYLVFLFEIELMGVVLYILSRFKNLVEENIDIELAKEFFTFSKKHSVIVIAINLLLLYVYVTSVTVVNEKNIIKYSWYNLKGIEYEYEDVAQVDTGFRGNVLGLPGQKRGDFYYNITFNNGKEIKFWASNTEKYDFTYTEYKVVDDIIMKNKVKKIGSTINVKYAQLGQEYIDFLCDVINNK